MFPFPYRGGGCVVLLAVAITPGLARAGDVDSDAAAPLSPEAAVAAALDVHPDIQQAQAALARATGVRAASSLLLANPELAAGSTLDAARASIELTQDLSLTGAGWHQRAASIAAIDAAEQALRRARLVAAADTRRTYIEATVATGRASVAAEGVELAARLSQAVQQQFEAGEASSLDVRLARLAEVQTAATLLAERQAEAEALQELAERVGRPVAAEALVVDPLAVAPVPVGGEAVTRSDLIAAEERLRGADAELRLQRASSLAPVSIGIFADVEDGQTYIGPSLALELPLFQRNQAGRAGALAQVQVAEAQLSSLSARARTEVLTATRRQAEAAALAEALIDDPITEARASLASIEAAWLAGEIDLPRTVLLQAQVLEGQAAAIELLGLVGAARIDLLLANEDPALIGGAP